MPCPRRDEPRAIFFLYSSLLHVSRRARRISLSRISYLSLCASVSRYDALANIIAREPQSNGQAGKHLG